MRKKFSWGVPGKRFNVYDRTNDLKPQPLNKNPFDSWDAKKSNFQRIDLVPQIVVGGGGPYNATPEPTPTPSSTPPSLPNCYWSAQTGTWEFTTQDWDGCESPPSPSQTPTNTPTPSITPTIGPGTAAANLYLSAVTFAGGTGITSTESGATQTLFTQLFTNNLWDKMVAFYPLLGGVSASCKFNAKSPYDTNNDYRLTFNGGWTFGVSGATGNGTNAYANTFMSATEEPDVRSFGVYGQVLNAEGSNLGNSTSYLVTRETFGTRAAFQFGGGSAVTASGSTSQGIYIGRRLNTTASIWRNGVQLDYNGVGSNSWGTDELYLGAQNGSGVASDFSSNGYGFVFMAESLSTTELTTLTNIINTFATTIGRNTY